MLLRSGQLHPNNARKQRLHVVFIAYGPTYAELCTRKTSDVIARGNTKCQIVNWKRNLVYTVMTHS